MKVEELILAKCINNEENDFVLGQLYIVDEIHIGQSSSSVRIDGIYCNSIWFKYYDASMVEIDIYKSKYSPYFKEEDKEIEEVLDINLLGQCDNWLQKRNVNIKSDFELNPYILEAITDNFKLLYHKQCELVKAVNELKKGK